MEYSNRSLSLGAFIPQPEIGNDPAEVRRFARTVEELGFDYLMAYDHVVVGPAARESMGNHEPLALLGFLAAATERLRLMTGVIILPQRQATLVAKQAATVDLLSGGRLILGVGIGWNELEFQALNEAFDDRARRFEEQIALMRALWQHETVDFDGRWHRVEQAGLAPLPAQRPIPLWIGGSAEPAVRRAARIADGFLVNRRPGPEAARTLKILREELALHGRDPAAFGLEGKLALGGGDPDRWRRDLGWWRAQGITHVTFMTSAGQDALDEHLRQLEAGLAAIRGL